MKGLFVLNREKILNKIYFCATAMSLNCIFGCVSLEATDMQDFSQSRAGVVLLKKYPEGDWGILLGQKAQAIQKHKTINFPSGQYDVQDGENLENTAIREMIEETGGQYSPLINVTSDKFYKTWSTFVSGQDVPPYIDHRNKDGHIRLYFLDVTSMDHVGRFTLSKGVKSAIADPNLSRDFKEVSNYWAVPLNEVYEAAQIVNFTKNNNYQNRSVTSRGNQISLQIVSYYMAPLAGKLAEFRKIMINITGQDPQTKYLLSSSSSLNQTTLEKRATSSPVFIGTKDDIKKRLSFLNTRPPRSTILNEISQLEVQILD